MSEFTCYLNAPLQVNPPNRHEAGQDHVLSDRQMWTRAALVLVAFGAIASAALLLHPPAPAPPANLLAPLPSSRRHTPAPGETESYSLSLNGVTAGALQTAFARVVEDGRENLEFQYSLEPTGALQAVWAYKLTGRTLMDPQTLRARSGRTTSRSGDHEKITTVRFEPAAGVAAVEVSKPYKKGLKRTQIPIAAALDLPAALVLLRTADWTRGPAAFYVLNGDALYRWNVSYVRRQSIVVPAGQFDTDALLVDAHEMDVQEGKNPVPKEKGQTVRVWVARDTGVLVRVEAALSLGTFQADLTERAD
jgi:hypothetical protein